MMLFLFLVNCFSILAWEIPQTEKLGRVYSPWDRKESDTTERLTLSLLFWEKSIQKYISTVADY